MPVKYIIMLVFIFMLLHLALIPMGNTAFNAETAERLNRVSFFGIAEEETVIGRIAYVISPTGYFNDLFWLMTSSFKGNPIFTGPGQLVGWMVLGPIVAGWVIGLIILFWGIFQRTLSGGLVS